MVNSNASDNFFMDGLNSLNMNFNNDSGGCNHYTCLFLDELGPPPDWLIPPPPLPPFIKDVLTENKSIKIDEECTFCHIFAKPLDSGSEFVFPESKIPESWISLAIVSLLGSIFLIAVLTIIIIKWRQWKMFPLSDFCPLFPDGFLGRQKPALPPSTLSDSCISPVVNEKSPQSIITNFPNKRTTNSSKYWSGNNDIALRNGVNPRLNQIEDYAKYSESGSCTSSPVYAELDSNGDQSISPYAVRTYSDVNDTLRMAPFASAILPDSSYDNAAYLSSSNSDQYNGRNARRNRPGLGHFGSATPLLSSQHHVLSSPNNYFTTNRIHKKNRNPYNHPIQQNFIRNHQNIEPYNRFSTLRSDGIYRNVPVHSSISAFRVPFSTTYRDIPKRQLPLVPGVRL